MERTAYMQFLIDSCKSDVKQIALRLRDDIVWTRNQQAFDILDKTGDIDYSVETFVKAARLVLSSEK